MTTMNDDSMKTAYNSLNKEQREIFDMVTESIKKQLTGSDKKLRLFISGESGCGKTFLLNLLKHQIDQLFGYNTAVVACAPTGVAARDIEGSTINSVFALPFEDLACNRDLETPQTLKTSLLQKWKKLDELSSRNDFENFLPAKENLIQKWKNIEFLLIDEVSMVSYETLHKIDLRLREFKNYKGEEHFGNIHVILFGDLMQLPPVRQNPIYTQPRSLLDTDHLWRSFDLFEIKENMRPKRDAMFHEILSALRIGQLKEQHLIELENHLISDPEIDNDVTAICLTWFQVNGYNESTLKEHAEKGVILHEIKAIDKEHETFEFPSTAVATGNNKKDKLRLKLESIENQIYTRKNIFDTNYDEISIERVMPKTLKLCVGAKVMLRYNIDVKRGLLKGAVGVVTEIGQVTSNQVPSVSIDFGNLGVHVIRPIRTLFTLNKKDCVLVEREMLPLILSWARTVHLTQGTMFEKAIIYLGDGLFTQGQAYVALSSVKSLEGLLIAKLDREKLTDPNLYNTEAMQELERMKWNKMPA